MDERKNRQKVMQALEEAMRVDRAPYKILQFNDFGLVAITRKRVKQSLERTLCSPCPHCEGAGYIKSAQTVVSEILIEARKLARSIEGKDVLLRVHPDVGKVLKSNQNKFLEELEEILRRPVLIKSDPQLHHEKFDLAWGWACEQNLKAYVTFLQFCHGQPRVANNGPQGSLGYILGKVKRYRQCAPVGVAKHSQVAPLLPPRLETSAFQGPNNVLCGNGGQFATGHPPPSPERECSGRVRRHGLSVSAPYGQPDSPNAARSLRERSGPRHRRFHHRRRSQVEPITV